MSQSTFSISQGNLAIQILNELIQDDPKSSIIYSPISLAIAFSMAYIGSSGSTKESIKKYFFNGCDDEEIHENFHKFLVNLQENDNNSLKTVNKLYIKEGVNLLELFTQTIKNYYQGQFEKIDFASPNACNIINKFVEDSTNNLIKDLLQPDDLDDETLLVIINAIYFKNKWAIKFDKNLTLIENFYVSENVTKKVDLMYNSEKHFYYENNDYQMVKLNYESQKQNMVILLPKEKYSLLKKMPSLDGKHLFNMIDLLKSVKVNLFLPKFKIESAHKLVETFKKLGLKVPFSNHADFSLITKDEALKIDKIIQKAFIEVDEVGTEAAAATAIVFAKTTSVRISYEPEYTFRADHPFVYFIIDDKYNILFNGIYQ